MTMTGEQFLAYIREANIYRCRGKTRQNLLLSRYQAYVKAYRVATFKEAYWLHLDRANHGATVKGLGDRDEGLPMVSVPELLGGGVA